MHIYRIHVRHSPVSDERCGVPRLISRLPPILVAVIGPLLLGRRGLCDGLDTLTVWPWHSTEESNETWFCLLCSGFDPDNRRGPFSRFGEEDNGIPGREGARWRRCFGSWWLCCCCCWWLPEVDGDPLADDGFEADGDGNGPTEMEVDLRLLRSPLVG